MVSPSTPLRVLVVDDDADVQEVLVLMISRFGHTAEGASDGVEAIEALGVHAYDLVLLDLMMPRVTGEEVLRWLEQHPERRSDTRVIVLTGSADEQRVKLEALGAHAVLPKPLDLEQLQALLSCEGSQRGAAG